MQSRHFLRDSSRFSPAETHRRVTASPAEYLAVPDDPAELKIYAGQFVAILRKAVERSGNKADGIEFPSPFQWSVTDEEQNLTSRSSFGRLVCRQGGMGRRFGVGGDYRWKDALRRLCEEDRSQTL